MPADDPLTPEEVERLDPETRGNYESAEREGLARPLEVRPAWLRDHITRAARMEAAMAQMEATLRRIGGLTPYAGEELLEASEASYLARSAVPATERSK